MKPTDGMNLTEQQVETIRTALGRSEWTCEDPNDHHNPRLFCPCCSATCDYADRHEWEAGECVHCGAETPEDLPAGAYTSEEGECPRAHAEGCQLFAALNIVGRS